MTPSGAGPTDASSPAGFGPVPGPVLSLSFKCYGRPSVCITSRLRTLPHPGPQTATIWQGWSVVAHIILQFFLFLEN